MNRRNKLHAEALSGRIQRQSERLAEEVRALGSVALDATGNALRKARRRGELGLEGGRERLRHGADEVEEYVVDNPWRALFAALGAGLLLGLFLRR